MTKAQAEEVAAHIEELILASLLRDRLKNNQAGEAADHAFDALVEILERL